MSTTITIPNVQLTLDQLVAAVRQLASEERAAVAQALMSEEIDARFERLIKRLANMPPAADLTDEEINKEVRATLYHRNQNVALS